ncbi:hypothetical protein SAMN05216436_101156 [bacterium A37T11]|nr:hypothetical protein SAMN05216436_101156 [bacterium A37T11]
MQLSRENYGKVLVKTLLQQAGKCLVRECDEQPPGTFVSYVDEATETYDVSISLDEKGEVSAHSCDCGQPAFCRHRAALLMYVADNPAGKAKTPVKGIKRVKKLSPALQLLENTDATALKAWLGELFTKNKDAELAFVHHFSDQEKVYTPSDAEKITLDAVQAVVKNRKKLDVSEVKKLVELWEKVHTPMVEYYQDHATDPKAFLLFHSLLESCLDFQAQIRTNSTRIPKYVEHRLRQSVPALFQLQQAEAWETAFSFFVKNLIISNHPEVRLNYLKHLDNLCQVADPNRRQQLIQQLLQLYATIDAPHMLNGDRYTITLFQILQENDLFKAHADLFKPISYNNDFNMQLIGELIRVGNTSRAAQYCQEQIRNNVREEFNIPYWQLLRDIYRTHHQDQQLMRVLTGLVPYTFQPVDFLWVSAQLTNQEERYKWRSKIWNKAHNELQKGNLPALLFTFGVLHAEQEYKRMVQQLAPYVPYQLILTYGPDMATADKLGLLKGILTVNDSYLRILWDYKEADVVAQRQAFPALLELLLMHFPRLELSTLIKQHLKNQAHAQHNAFLLFLQGRL